MAPGHRAVAEDEPDHQFLSTLSSSDTLRQRVPDFLTPGDRASCADLGALSTAAAAISRIYGKRGVKKDTAEAV
jgi:hypothetical protein